MPKIAELTNDEYIVLALFLAIGSHAGSNIPIPLNMLFEAKKHREPYQKHVNNASSLYLSAMLKFTEACPDDKAKDMVATIKRIQNERH